MEIKKLSIRNFRGIQKLDWLINGKFICLIGAGDSTKSTILDAIELLLTHRRAVHFDDCDFFNANVDEPIVIQADIIENPTKLLAESKFGLMIRGWDGNSVIDEPGHDDLPLLSIRLTVDNTLEPVWKIVNERESEGRSISAFDRTSFCVSRIGDFYDREFSWAYGSAMSRIMKEKDNILGALTHARRQAKNSLNPNSIPQIRESASTAQKIAKDLGIASRSDLGFVPQLDLRNLTINSGVLTLHDGLVPMRQCGLGSSRLLIAGIQHSTAKEGGINLFDEIEHGLEPHRVRRLLNFLQKKNHSDQNNEGDETQFIGNQYIITTHSPIVLCELEPENLRVVRCDNGKVTIGAPGKNIRPILRSNPEAFLARKIVVCEGKTEIGLCKALDKFWSETVGSFAYAGVTLTDGSGTSGPAKAVEFANLLYKTAFFGDSDVQLNPNQDELVAQDVVTLLWDGEMSTEERVFSDLPFSAVVKAIELAIEEHGLQRVRDVLAPFFKCKPADIPGNVTEWEPEFSESVIRSKFAEAAKQKDWFKRVDLAEGLGGIIVESWAEITERPLGTGISKLKEWVYDNT